MEARRYAIVLEAPVANPRAVAAAVASLLGRRRPGASLTRPGSLLAQGLERGEAERLGVELKRLGLRIMVRPVAGRPEFPP